MQNYINQFTFFCRNYSLLLSHPDVLSPLSEIFQFLPQQIKMQTDCYKFILIVEHFVQGGDKIERVYRNVNTVTKYAQTNLLRRNHQVQNRILQCMYVKSWRTCQVSNNILIRCQRCCQINQLVILFLLCDHWICLLVEQQLQQSTMLKALELDCCKVQPKQALTILKYVRAKSKKK